MTIYSGDDVLHLRMETKVDFIRVIEGEFMSSWATIISDIDINTDYDDEEIDFAIAKIRSWYSDVVARCIIISCDDQVASKVLIDENSHVPIKNLLMITPGIPSDHTLASVFKAKMNALGNGIVAVPVIEIETDASDGFIHVIHGFNPTGLPTMEAWVGTPNYFDKPWWHRDDATTIDSPLKEGIDPSVPPKWFFRMEDLMGQGSAPVHPKGEFKPKIIPGGKR
jgi:hypothetical protein